MKTSKEELASVFGYFLKNGLLSETICEFLKYKIQSSELKSKSGVVIDTVSDDLYKYLVQGRWYVEFDLRWMNLNNINLTGANLRGADLREVNLEGADLTGTIFDEDQINYLENKYDLSKANVRLSIDKIISYRKYKERMSKRL